MGVRPTKQNQVNVVKETNCSMQLLDIWGTGAQEPNEEHTRNIYSFHAILRVCVLPLNAHAFNLISTSIRRWTKTKIRSIMDQPHDIRSHTCHAVGSSLLIVGGWPPGERLWPNGTACEKPSMIQVVDMNGGEEKIDEDTLDSDPGLPVCAILGVFRPYHTTAVLTVYR